MLPTGTAILRGRRSTLATQGVDFVACALFCARARSSADFVAGAVFSQSRVQISWQAQHFRKVR